MVHVQDKHDNYSPIHGQPVWPSVPDIVHVHPSSILLRPIRIMNRSLWRWFREQFGVTPLDFINQERIKLAKQLLAKPQNNVHTVSDLCGFSDVNYFVRLFKKMEGVTPKAYQVCMMKV